jgi:hypothetical protein
MLDRHTRRGSATISQRCWKRAVRFMGLQNGNLGYFVTKSHDAFLTDMNPLAAFFAIMREQRDTS